MSIIQCYEVTVGHEDTEGGGGGQVPPISTRATLRLKKQTFSKNAWNKKRFHPTICADEKNDSRSLREMVIWKKCWTNQPASYWQRWNSEAKGTCIQNITIFIFGFLKGFFFFLSFAKAVQSSADWKFRPWHRPNHIWSSRLCYRRKQGVNLF